MHIFATMNNSQGGKIKVQQITYTEMTLLLGSHITFDQVQGLT